MSDASDDSRREITLERAFRITPAGGYEAAYLRFLFEHTYPKLMEQGEGYYGSLVRPSPPGLRDQAATMAVLAEEVWLGGFDWVFRGKEGQANYNGRTFRNRELGVGFSYLNFGEWYPDLTRFVGMLVEARRRHKSRSR